MALLSVTNLCNHYDGKQVLRNCSFELQAGEILGLAGGSGSGKSTLARCIAGLIPFSSGEMLLADKILAAKRSTAQFRAQSKQLQMVFQDPYTAVNARWQILDIVLEPMNSASLSSQQKIALASEWLAKVNLSDALLTRLPSELSGGQLQRINIARALIAKPQLLICDESLAALDVSTQAQVANLLKDLRDEFGISLLFIGHDLSMMNFLCDRIAVMESGQIVEINHTQQLLNQPQHPYSQRLIHNAQHKARAM